MPPYRAGNLFNRRARMRRSPLGTARTALPRTAGSPPFRDRAHPPQPRPRQRLHDFSLPPRQARRQRPRRPSPGVKLALSKGRTRPEAPRRRRGRCSRGRCGSTRVRRRAARVPRGGRQRGHVQRTPRRRFHQDPPRNSGLGRVHQQHGGLNGHPVRLIVYDDGADPARSRAQVQEAVERQRVVAFLQMSQPLSGESNVDYITAKRIPVIGTETGSPWVYDRSPMYFPQTSPPMP